MTIQGTLTTDENVPPNAIAYDPNTIILINDTTTANYTKSGSELTITDYDFELVWAATFPDTTDSTTIDTYLGVFEGIAGLTLYQWEFDENYEIVFAEDENGEKIPVPGTSGGATKSTDGKTITMSITMTGLSFADELPTTTGDLDTAFPEGATITANSNNTVYTITYSYTVTSNGWTIPCTATTTLTKK